MWLHIRKEYYLILNVLFSSFSVLCEEDEKAIVEHEDFRFPEDEDPNPQTYPPYQTICTDLPQYKKLSEHVAKIFSDFDEKFTKLENRVNKLTEDLKMCNTLTTKLEGDIQEIKKSESTHKAKIEEQIEAIEKKLKKYFSKLSDAEREVEELDKNLSNRNKQLIGLEDKYEIMEDSMKKISSTLEEVAKRNDEQDKLHEEQMKKVEQNITALSQNMTESNENMEKVLSNVTSSIENSLSRTLTTAVDVRKITCVESIEKLPRISEKEEPDVVKVDDIIIDVKRFGQNINAVIGKEKSFTVTDEGVQSEWKFYLTLTNDKNCQSYNLRFDSCRFIGVYVRMRSTKSREKIAAKFEILFQDVLGNVIKTQTSSLKEFKPSTKFGWPMWVSVEELMKSVDFRDNFQAVLKLQLYPEGSYLYEEDRDFETQKLEWDLPDIQHYLPDSQTKNVSMDFKIGNETGVHTKWRAYLGHNQNYVKFGVQLLESSWKIVYASWTVELYDYNEDLRANTSTYAKAYQEGAEAVKDSHFYSVEKLQNWRRSKKDQCIRIKIEFTVYGKTAKLYKDVRI